MKTMMSSRSAGQDVPSQEIEDKKSVKEVVAELRTNFKDAREFANPYWAGLAPTLTVGGLWGAGAALAASPDAWNAWMYPAGLGFAAVGLSFARPVAHWLKNHMPGAWWARTTIAAGTGWLAVAGATSADEPTPVLLMAAGIACSVPWWLNNHRRVGELEQPKGPSSPFVRNGRPARPGEPASAAPEGLGDGSEQGSEEDLEGSQLALEPSARTIWETQLAVPDGPFADAELDQYGWEPTEYGDTAGFWLPRSGLVLIDEAISRTLRVHTMLRKQVGHVQIEAHEDCVEGHVRITLLERLPVEEGRAWAGPNLDPVTGIMPLGIYADGKGEAAIRLFKPGAGMRHLLVAGGTGAGKSYLLSNIIAAIEHSGVGVTWLADPQGGQSIPEWAEEGSLERVALDMESIRLMIQAAFNVMMANSEMLTSMWWEDHKGRRRKGKRAMDPTPEMPFLALVLEEAHMVLKDPEIAQMVGLIAKMGRKAGVLLVLVTQTPTQEELGGAHGGAIRDNVLMGNIVTLRTMSRMTSSMLSLPVDPNKLPAKFADGSDTSGIGFVQGETTRGVMFRADYDEDPYQWVVSSPHTRLHTEAAEAALAAFDNAEVSEQVAGGDGAQAPNGLPTGGTFNFSFKGVPFPEIEEEKAEEEKEDKRAKTKILAYVRKHGPATPTRISIGIGRSVSHTHRCLLALTSDGLLANDGSGIYSLPDEPVEAVSELETV